MENVLNIINFARGIEPRAEDDSFLFETFEQELALCRQYGFKSTSLLQYDVLIDKRYTDAVKQEQDLVETGIWFEVVEPLCRDCAIEWRGRYPWDWHNDVGFLIGYNPEERIKLIDAAFGKFKKIFGFYPEVVGSWHIDAFSLNYMSCKYGIKAACICKEQCGTDGYTLWGGVYSGAYFPSVKNMLCPASTEKNKIPVPVFRMLGSDPVFQYECGIDKPQEGQAVESLEPVYPLSGGNEQWVRLFMNENFNGKSLALAYAQAGQENSFGAQIFDGLPMQFRVFAEYEKQGKIRVETLGESGNNFCSTYAMTPPQCQCFDRAFGDGGEKTMWYNSMFYRVNFHYNGSYFYIRDLHLFREDFEEDYLCSPVKTHNCEYRNFPVMDGFGFGFGENGLHAGIYFCSEDGAPVKTDGWQTRTSGEETAVVTAGPFEAVCNRESVRIFSEREYVLRFISKKNCIVSFSEHEINMSFKKYSCSLKIKKGRVCEIQGDVCISPSEGEVLIITG